MLTPRFELSQDDEFVYIKIQILNIRFSAKGIEMEVNDNVFVFSLPPYYLRLRFPCKLLETEDSTSEFVPKEECIKVRVSKLNKGEFFPDLDLSAKLLARINEPTSLESNTKKPLIEEMDLDSDDKEAQQNIQEQPPTELQKIEQEGMDYDWEISQTLPDPLTDLKSSVKYGFNNQYANYLTTSLANGNDINEISDPDHLQPDDRIMERLIAENIKFDMEYYANDYITVKYLSQAESGSNLFESLAYISKYAKLYQSSSSKTNIEVEFSQDEHDKMNDLPKKTYLIDDARPLYYTILCLLYAYSYELRSFQGETTIESAWTIGKLTPQIACLDSQLIQSNNKTETNMIKIILLTLSRRSLDYPLYRHYDLIKKTWMDVYWILRCGKRSILKALLEIRELFRKHDIYYVYCKILLDDLCAWVLRDDKCNENIIRNLAHALRKETDLLKKEDIVFEKIIKSEEGEESMEDENEFEFINLVDVEELADEAYRSTIQ